MNTIKTNWVKVPPHPVSMEPIKRSAPRAVVYHAPRKLNDERVHMVDALLHMGISKGDIALRMKVSPRTITAVVFRREAYSMVPKKELI